MIRKKAHIEVQKQPKKAFSRSLEYRWNTVYLIADNPSQRNYILTAQNIATDTAVEEQRLNHSVVRKYNNIMRKSQSNYCSSRSDNVLMRDKLQSILQRQTLNIVKPVKLIGHHDSCHPLLTLKTPRF